MAAQARLFFPGFVKHHSLRVWGAMQFKGKFDNYIFGSPAFFPRGYAYQFFNSLYTGSVAYQFPIAYPDLSIGRFLYIQRLKTNIFTDFGMGSLTMLNGRTANYSKQYNSVGIDLSADFNIMRLRQSFEIGVRAIYTADGRAIFQPLVIDIGF